jgi:hypothetical protein
MSAWTDYVTKYFNERRKTQPDYKFKDALKDASVERKKNGTQMVKPVKSIKRKSAKRKSRKNRR